MESSPLAQGVQDPKKASLSPCSLGGSLPCCRISNHTRAEFHLTVIKYLLGFSVQAWTGPGTEGPQATALSRHAGNTHGERRQTGVWAAGALNTANTWGWQGLGKVAAHCSSGRVLGGDQEGGDQAGGPAKPQVHLEQSQGLWALGVLWALLPQAPGLL